MMARYVNHNGDAVELNGNGVHFIGSAMQDWGLEHSAVNGRTASFRRPAKEKTFEAVIAAASDDEGAELRNRIYEVAIVDVEANSPGRLYVGDWYMEGYLVRSGKASWWYNGRNAEYSFSFLADDPRWTREHQLSFHPVSEGATAGLNHPYDYMHDYCATAAGSNALDNPSVLSAPARITIYGPAENPRIVIGGNAYAVETAVPDGGVLTIDAPSRTIVKRDRYGAESNCFQFRAGNQRKGGGSYIFEPVPAGISEVSWDGSFGFDLTLYEKRDEWRW